MTTAEMRKKTKEESVTHQDQQGQNVRRKGTLTFEVMQSGSSHCGRVLDGIDMIGWGGDAQEEGH